MLWARLMRWRALKWARALCGWETVGALTDMTSGVAAAVGAVVVGGEVAGAEIGFAELADAVPTDNVVANKPKVVRTVVAAIAPMRARRVACGMCLLSDACRVSCRVRAVASPAAFVLVRLHPEERKRCVARRK